MKRAEEILTTLENSAPEPVHDKKISAQVEDLTQDLFLSRSIEDFLKVDVTTLTPIEALNKLYELQKNFRKATGN